MRSIFTLSFAFAVLFSGSCTTDTLPEPTPTPCDNVMPTYTTNIRPIIEESCSYSGCHLGGAPGLYDNYGGLLADLESGLFRQRVLLRKDDPNVGMPPDYAPEDRPKDLTDEELILIECWLEAGYPES